jgi:hypothetical protein
MMLGRRSGSFPEPLRQVGRSCRLPATALADGRRRALEGCREVSRNSGTQERIRRNRLPPRPPSLARGQIPPLPLRGNLKRPPISLRASRLDVATIRTGRDCRGDHPVGSVRVWRAAAAATRLLSGGGACGKGRPSLAEVWGNPPRPTVLKGHLCGLCQLPTLWSWARASNPFGRRGCRLWGTTAAPSLWPANSLLESVTRCWWSCEVKVSSAALLLVCGVRRSCGELVELASREPRSRRNPLECFSRRSRAGLFGSSRGDPARPLLPGTCP